jgi:hypothetical protein
MRKTAQSLPRHSTCDNWVRTRFAVRSFPPNKTPEFQGLSQNITGHSAVALAMPIPINALTRDTREPEFPLNRSHLQGGEGRLRKHKTCQGERMKEAV